MEENRCRQSLSYLLVPLLSPTATEGQRQKVLMGDKGYELNALAYSCPHSPGQVLCLPGQVLTGTLGRRQRSPPMPTSRFPGSGAELGCLSGAPRGAWQARQLPATLPSKDHRGSYQPGGGHCVCVWPVLPVKVP